MNHTSRELTYEELIEQFDLIPRTFIPGLMIRLTEVGYNKLAFKPGGASMLVRGTEARIPGLLKAEKAESPDAVIQTNTEAMERFVKRFTP